MRPLKLIISAFGPYAAQETIDFSTLKNKNIFLVTGPTGAGKTTIFDAISYALFGEASGSSRDNDSLRSHFASQEIETFVQLDFELRGEVYKVKRSPKQEIKKARGEGFRIKESDAEIILPNGTVVTKISNVDSKINELLGINKNQFRQIVMLPQGEFRKLLEAESREREVIFRKIFGTEAFQIIQQKLDNLQKDYYRKVKEGETRRETHIKHINAGEDELLIKLINAEYLNVTEIILRTKKIIELDELKDNEIKSLISHVKKQQTAYQQKIIEGKEINKKLKDKEDILNNFNLQDSKMEENKQREASLEKGRKALQVKMVEDIFIERKKNLNTKTAEYKASEEIYSKAEKNTLYWEEKLKEEESKEALRKNLSNEVAFLKSKEEKVKAYEEKVSAVVYLKKDLEEKKKVIEEIKKSLVRDKEGLELSTKNLMMINGFELERAEYNKQVSEKNAAVEMLRELRTKTRQYINNVCIYDEEKESFSVFEEDFLDCRNKYETKEDCFLKAQAGILASTLVEGNECPVCGSKSHPKKAPIFAEVPTEEELKIAREHYEIKNNERSKKLQRLAKLNGQIEEGLRELKDTKSKMSVDLGNEILTMTDESILDFINEKGPKLRAELDRLEAKLKELDEAIAKKIIIEQSRQQLEDKIKEKETKVPVLEEEYTKCYGRLSSEEEIIRNIELEIPEEIRSMKYLLNKIKLQEEMLIALEEAFKKTQNSFLEAKNKQTSALAHKDVLQKNVREAEEEVKLYEKNLNDRLNEFGFGSFEEYKALEISEEKINELDREIREFYNKLQSLKDSLEKAAKDTEGISYVEVDVLVKELEELLCREEEFNQKEKNIYLRIINNINVLKDIERINAEIGKDEEKHNIINDISKAANGFNSERITFERYVLAAYFDEIISAANLRLNKMTGGRFILKRKLEKGKGLKQEGLELEVFDNYTGKARHVKTLSGGESFKASLALALGLADVVQAYAGGISLDTMFVDEGFGTLDPESLDNAIQCLIDLQKGGRLVGIISHVPELRERINVRLEITPAKEGSKAKFVV